MWIFVSQFGEICDAERPDVPIIVSRVRDKMVLYHRALRVRKAAVREGEVTQGPHGVVSRFRTVTSFEPERLVEERLTITVLKAGINKAGVILPPAFAILVGDAGCSIRLAQDGAHEIVLPAEEVHQSGSDGRCPQFTWALS